MPGFSVYWVIWLDCQVNKFIKESGFKRLNLLFSYLLISFRIIATTVDKSVADDALNYRAGMIWKRPNPTKSIPFPHTWHTFNLTDSKTGEEIEYEIKDIPVKRYKEAVNMMALFLLKTQPGKKFILYDWL